MNQEWKHVRKHQINNSSSKSTFAFSKSNRFDQLKTLYIFSDLVVIVFIIYRLIWEKIDLLELERAIKCFFKITRKFLHLQLIIFNHISKTENFEFQRLTGAKAPMADRVALFSGLARCFDRNISIIKSFFVLTF